MTTLDRRATFGEKDSREVILEQARVGRDLVNTLRELRKSARLAVPSRLEHVTGVVHELLLELREGSARITSIESPDGGVSGQGPEAAELRTVAVALKEELRINRIVFDSALEMTDHLIRGMLGGDTEQPNYGRTGRRKHDRAGTGRILTRTV